MTDLAAWLLKQFNLLATDEMPDLHLRTCRTHKLVPRGAPSVIVGTPMTCNCRALDFWLADLAAKRRLAELHESERGHCSTCLESESDLFGKTYETAPCMNLRLLALPYAHRPGYREEWRP